MALSDQHDTEPLLATNCPGCGRPVSSVRYCPDCGHAIALPASTRGNEQTVVTPPVSVPPRAAAAGHRLLPAAPRRSRAVVLGAAGALGLAVIAVVAIVVLTSSSSSSAPLQSYRQKLALALAPVLAANRTLTVSLQSLNGSHATIIASKNATAQALSALTAASGALAVLSVPASEQTLAQQAQQALTEETGYAKAISSALTSPSGQSSTLRALATSTQSALVPLSVVAADAPASLAGTDNLISWVDGASAAVKRQAAAAQRKALKQAAATHTTTVIQTPPSPPVTSTLITPSGSPVPGSWGDSSAAFASGIGTPYAWAGGENCDQNIFAGDGTPCSFANNIFMVVAAASHYSNVIPASISALSPADGTSYGLSCTEYTGTDSQTDVQCITATGAGSAFPVWAANVYYG
jgi:hypothetical protein